DLEQRQTASHRMIAKMPTIAAMAYKYSVGQPFIYPRNDLDYTSNFLQMCFAVPCEPYIVNPIVARALDCIFILHADHEQNASTSTVRLAGSSGANPFACIAAGIACLWGPAHGGANEAALQMLEEIGDVSKIGDFIKRVKDKHSGIKLMGFGHRVYKNYDPRAKLMRETCHEVLDALGLHDDPIFKLAMALEKIALEDEYFVARKLYPNVDFYSGIVQRAIGIPVSLFTAIFALARTVGRLAQLNEMIGDPEYKIGRPQGLACLRQPGGERPQRADDRPFARHRRPDFQAAGRHPGRQLRQVGRHPVQDERPAPGHRPRDRPGAGRDAARHDGRLRRLA